MGELLQPLDQALAHLARRLLGEGDGQNFVRAHRLARAGLRLLLRAGAVEQRAHDARDQHPGLAGAGAGLHGHAAARIAGDGVKGLGGNGLAVAGVGGGHVRF